MVLLSIRMFTHHNILHEHHCRLSRLTIVMTISSHPWALDIAWIRLWVNINMSSVDHDHSTPSSYHNDHHNTVIQSLHHVWIAITPSSYTYTHSLIIITHLNMLEMISSHLAMSLITYVWHSRMLRHISAQRIKTTNKSIAHSRSTCMSILIT